MADLLTSLDVVNQSFKKTMRGYDPAEVDEFLDHIAECLQAYAQKTKDYERDLDTQKEKLEEYAKLKDSLHEALLMAQKTADERIRNATVNAETIVLEAQTKAAGIVREAEEKMAKLGTEIERLMGTRTDYIRELKSIAAEFQSVLEKAEHANVAGFTERRTAERHEPAAEAVEAPSEDKKADIASALSAIGIDPNLVLNSESS